MQPHRTPSAWMRAGTHANSFWGPAIRERVASQVDAIRHWKVILGSYEALDDVEATWFIDPPYDHESGLRYRKKVDDFAALGDWCRERRGQVVVCERDGATWLPFRPFCRIKATSGSRGKGYSTEVIWTPVHR